MDQSRGRERDSSILPVESAYHIDSRERLGVSEPLLPKPILLCDHVKSAVGTFRMNQMRPSNSACQLLDVFRIAFCTYCLWLQKLPR